MQCGRPPHCAPALTTARDSKGHLEPSPGLEPLEYPFLENRFSPCGLGISPHQRRRLSLCSSKPQARRIHPFPGFPCLTPHTAKQDGGVCECVCEREQRGSPPRPRVYECASIRVHVGGSTRGTGTDSAEPPRVSVCECAWGEHARHRHRQRGAPHRGRRRAGQVPGRPPTMPPAGPPPPLPTDLAPVLAPAHVGHGRPVSPPPCARAAWAHGRHSSCPFLLSPPRPPAACHHTLHIQSFLFKHLSPTFLRPSSSSSRRGTSDTDVPNSPLTSPSLLVNLRFRGKKRETKGD